jgi:putative addiction module component (TIGR02574 family)
MSSTADELFERAMELSPDERKRLGIRLLESDEAEDDPLEVEAAWAKEIERRVAEIDAGTAELLDWQEVRAHLHRKR